jgi:hypothetical protein
VTFALELQQQRGRQRVEAGAGEAAERAGDPVERPRAGDVGDRDGERDTALQPPQPRGDRVGKRARARFVAHRRQLRFEPRPCGVGPVAPQIGHKNRVL